MAIKFNVNSVRYRHWWKSKPYEFVTFLMNPVTMTTGPVLTGYIRGWLEERKISYKIEWNEYDHTGSIYVVIESIRWARLFLLVWLEGYYD